MVNIASSPEQIGEFELIVAAVGNAFTVTVVVTPESGRLQLPTFTLSRFRVVLAVTALTVTSTVPLAAIVAVPDAAPL